MPNLADPGQRAYRYTDIQGFICHSHQDTPLTMWQWFSVFGEVIRFSNTLFQACGTNIYITYHSKLFYQLTVLICLPELTFNFVIL